jgi:hypothetical protein
MCQNQQFARGTARNIASKTMMLQVSYQMHFAKITVLVSLRASRGTNLL